MSVPAHPFLDVHVLLIRYNTVLLSQRRGGDFDRLWHAPSGKVDEGEDAVHAAAREAAEEVGVLIDPADLDHVHTVHVAGSGPDSRIGLFFTARDWLGEPTNREPDKRWSVDWFALDALPGDMVPYPAAGIEAYRTGTRFGVFGWPAPAPAGPSRK